jgi:hypothetical protein
LNYWGTCAQNDHGFLDFLLLIVRTVFPLDRFIVLLPFGVVLMKLSHAARSVAVTACSAVCLSLFGSQLAHAATINYINPSAPPQSQVIAAVTMNASGWPSPAPTTLSHIAGSSLSHTVLGPVPPPLTTQTFGQAEIFTNLNSTGAGTSRTISVPGFGRFVAEGLGTTGTDFYTGNADVYSGDTSSTAPGTWTVHVDPTGIEVPGTPTLITIDASIVGELEVVGTSSADASWLVNTSFGTLMSGSASQSTPGLTPFSDSGSISFVIPLGGTFTLTLLYQLDAAGTGISNSRAEVFPSVVGSPAAPFGGGPLSAGPAPTVTAFTITAQVGAVPEPSTFALLGLGFIGLLGYRARRRRDLLS